MVQSKKLSGYCLMVVARQETGDWQSIVSCRGSSIKEPGEVPARCFVTSVVGTMQKMWESGRENVRQYIIRSATKK